MGGLAFFFGVTFPDAIFEWDYPERFVMKGSAQDVKGALQLAASRGALKAESAGDAGPLEFFIKGWSTPEDLIQSE